MFKNHRHFLVSLCSICTSLFAEQLYVVNDSGGISVIDVPAFTVAMTIPTSNLIFDIAFTADGKRAYIANQSNNTVQVYDVPSNSFVATISVQNAPFALADVVTGGNEYMYVTNNGSNTVSIINTANNHVIANVGVGASPKGIAVTPDNSLAFVCDSGTNEMSVINTSTQTVSTVALATGARPIDAAVTPDGSHVYVTDDNISSPNILAISTTSPFPVTATIPAISGPQGITIVPGSPAIAWVVNAFSTSLQLIDTSTNNVTLVPLGFNGADYDSVSLSGDFVYVSSGSSGTPGYTNTVSVFNTQTQVFVQTIAVGTFPGPSASTNATISPPTPTPSSSGPRGQQIANTYLTQIDFVNGINWNAPTNFSPVEYLIFRDAALTELAGTVSGSTLFFEDHNRQKGKTYTYFIIGRDASGNTMSIGSVTVF